jgi:hypothetical protein
MLGLVLQQREIVFRQPSHRHAVLVEHGDVELQ